MKKPRDGFNIPDFAGQSKILFCTEGNPTAMLLTNKAGRRKMKTTPFATAEAAVAWCRAHAAVLVYFPVNITLQ